MPLVSSVYNSDSVGVPVAQWVKRWPTDLRLMSSSPAQSEIFSAVNGVLLHTALTIFFAFISNCIIRHLDILSSANDNFAN